MGCLGKIFKLIIIILAIIGFKSIGGFGIFQGKFHLDIFKKPSQEVLQDKASKIADLSKVNDEYEIDKTAKVMGYGAVIAEHKGSGQKMVIVDSNKKDLLTKEDFKTKKVDEKLDDLVDKLQYQFIHLEDFEITQRGVMKSMGQNVPYVKFKAATVNMPFGEIQGIVGVAQDKDNKNKLVISLNEGGKYSQIITQQFFKDVR